MYNNLLVWVEHESISVLSDVQRTIYCNPGILDIFFTFFHDYFKKEKFTPVKQKKSKSQIYGIAKVDLQKSFSSLTITVLLILEY